MRPRLPALFIALAGVLPVLAHASETACEEAIQEAESRYPEIPTGLMAAIGRVESGRATKGGRLSPWPYTLNVDGSGYYFNNLGEAMGFLREDRNWQARSVDIGCMQVNIRYHPEAFGVQSHGFDPKRNVDYAAKFLMSLRQKHGSWSAAVMHYHSGDPVRQAAYLSKVRQVWRDTATTITADAGSLNRGPEASPVQVNEQTMQTARLRFANGDYAGAGQLCEAALKTPRLQQEAALCLGMIAESGGKPDKALGHYLEVLLAEPSHGPALRSITRMTQFAPKVFDGTWDKDLQWREPAHALPLLLTLSRSRLPKAGEHLIKARNLASNKGDAQALWMIATQYEAGGQSSVARQLYEQLLEELPQRQPNLAASMSPLIRERLQRLPAVVSAVGAPQQEVPNVTR